MIAFLGSFATFVGLSFSSSIDATDFPDFYCAARMVADGQGHQLYDANMQRRYQARYAGRIGTLYIHPPFEAVFYLVVAWLPIRRAYLLWSILNAVFLAAGVRRLAMAALCAWDWHLLLAASLTFIPLLLCFIQGQDSLLLLLLIILAFTAFRRDRAFAAGCWLGLALFKFQLVLPMVVVLILGQGKNLRGTLTMGFGSVALALVALSAAICGGSVFTVYPEFLLHLREQPFAGIVPLAMANFRGLANVASSGNHTAEAVVVVSILSVAALFKILSTWKYASRQPSLSPESNNNHEDEFDLAFANTILFALLVSYHLNPHDLSLLLVPIALLLHFLLRRPPFVNRTADWITIGLLEILFLPPLHVWGLKSGKYALLSLPITLLLFVNGRFRTQPGTVVPTA